MYPNAIARRANAATARGVAIDSGITIYNILNLVLVPVKMHDFLYPPEHVPKDCCDEG